MTCFYTFLLFTTFILVSVYASEPCCPDGWVYFQRSCYTIGHHALDFYEAENFCKHYGGHLVIIETAIENTFIKSYLGDIKDATHYIGLVDELIEGLWKWYGSGSVANFTDWYSGQPNGGKGENCVMMTSSVVYKWSDAACTTRYNPLCEISAASETQVVIG